MAEKEYIEREAAIEALSAEVLERNLDSVMTDDAHRYHRATERVIAGVPAADVRPVRHGKWIINDESRTVCSLCGNVVAFVSHPDRRWDFGNFCPNCGADMREES